MARKTTTPTLDTLRAEIDRIDDQIHDLLMQRTEIIDKVRRVKHGEQVKIRPARETEIASRLLARHKGAFPKQSLIHIWREIIAATLSLEGPFFVAVQAPDGDDGYLDLARDHYGAFTPLLRHAGAAGVIEAVVSGDAAIGVLPYPEHDDPDPWWRMLLGGEAPKVIARLPFYGRSNAPGADREALVICPNGPEPSGRDVSLIAFDADRQVSFASLRDAMQGQGLAVPMVTDWQPKGGGDATAYLMEVEGVVTAGDARLEQLNDRLDGVIQRFVWLGAYAAPFDERELASAVDERRGIDRRRKARDRADRRRKDLGRKARGRKGGS